MSTFTVKQISDRFNMSVHTIRYYDDQGLFPEVTRDPHGTRLFTEENMEWISLVICLRNTGMSIADIRHYIDLCMEGDSTIKERYHIILEQKERVENEILEMQNRLNVLNRKEKYYEQLISNQTCDSCNPFVKH
jgi:DNA-binding transcriptional MerR regulator